MEFKYKLEDFDSTLPYKDLELTEDVFEKQLAEQKLEEYAKSLGYKHFKRMLSSYRKQLRSIENATLVVSGVRGVTDFEGQKMEFRLASWNADETGIWRTGRDGLREKACSHPICPNRILTNIDTGEMKVELWYKRGTEGHPVTQIVDYDTIANAKNIVSLAKIGIDVDSNSAKNLVSYLSEITNMNYDQIPKVKTVTHLGWNREGFAPYTGDVEFDGSVSFENTFKSITQKGDYGKWIDEVENCRRYHTVVKIVMAALFASCLMEPLSILPFFVHLWSAGSATGKSVAVMCAASIWGDPRIPGDFFQSFRGTPTGFELRAGFLKSIPLFLDELQLKKDGHGHLEFNVYELAAGIGKIRGTKGLGLAAVPKWNMCFITTGESPMVSEHDGAGAFNRVIEIECTERDKVIEDGHKTAVILKENYGCAGRVFILKLMQKGNIDKAKILYERFYSECNKNQVTEKQAMAAAVMLTADSLACEWILNDKPITIADVEKFLKTIDSVSIVKRGYNYICDWAATNYGHFGTTDKGEIYGDIENKNDKTIAYIIRSVFNKVCESAGYNPKMLLSNFKEKGLIKLRSDGKGYTVSRQIMSGMPVADCVALKIMNDNTAIGTNDFDDLDL